MFYMNEKELLIFKTLSKLKELSFSDILRQVPFSREPTFRYLQSLHKQKLIVKRKIANIYLYSSDIKNIETVSVLSLLNNKKVHDYTKKINAVNIIEPLINKNIMFILLNESRLERRKKHISLIIVCSHNKKEIEESCEKLSKNLEYKSKLKINTTIYIYDDFINKIKENPSYLRELLENYLVVFDAERFYLEIRKFLT